jgi:hypothetical protein
VTVADTVYVLVRWDGYEDMVPIAASHSLDIIKQRAAVDAKAQRRPLKSKWKKQGGDLYNSDYFIHILPLEE